MRCCGGTSPLTYPRVTATWWKLGSPISDRIEGLNSGADDYLVKPFNLGELSARIMAVARRYAGSPQPTIRIGDIEIDQPQRRLTIADKSVILTGREWAVLYLLATRPGGAAARVAQPDGRGGRA